jgi:hypothetical protein
MSSTDLGDKLEAAIYNLFHSDISANRFCVRPDCCQIFRRKGYYSRDRQSNIIFDVSIEVYLPGATAYSLLWVIECKNYTHAVPVDDAEEFFAKLQQVSGANVKGVLASTGTFQDGTLKYCKSKGIGVLRYFNRSRFKWELHRLDQTFASASQSVDPKEVYRALVSPAYESQRFHCYHSSANAWGNSLSDLCLALARDEFKDGGCLARARSTPAASRHLVEFIVPDVIEEHANTVLADIGYNDGEVLLGHVCERETVKRRLNVTYAPAQGADLARGALGRICFDPPRIVIYTPTGTKKERVRFTLAHELGHYIAKRATLASRRQRHPARTIFIAWSGKRIALRPRSCCRARHLWLMFSH